MRYGFTTTKSQTSNFKTYKKIDNAEYNRVKNGPFDSSDDLKVPLNAHVPERSKNHTILDDIFEKCENSYQCEGGVTLAIQLDGRYADMQKTPYTSEEIIAEVEATMRFSDKELTNDEIEMLRSYQNGMISGEYLRRRIIRNAKENADGQL